VNIENVQGDVTVENVGGTVTLGEIQAMCQ